MYILNKNETIPREHRWIERCSIMNFAFPISGWWNVVKLVGISQNKLCIKDMVFGAYSPYARFTGYWYMEGMDLNSSSTLKSREWMSESDVIIPTAYNLVVYPIFKPYAECDLVVFAEDQKAFSKETPKIFTDRINKKYGKYRKSWYINA